MLSDEGREVCAARVLPGVALQDEKVEMPEAVEKSAYQLLQENTIKIY